MSSPVLLTTNGPRRVLTWRQGGSPKKQQNLTHFQFENRSRATRCRVLQSFAVPDKAVQFQQSLRETLEGISFEIRSFLRVHRTICTSVTQHNTTEHNKQTNAATKHKRTRTHKRTCTCTCACTCRRRSFCAKNMKPLWKVTAPEQHIYIYSSQHRTTQRMTSCHSVIHPPSIHHQCLSPFVQQKTPK